MSEFGKMVHSRPCYRYHPANASGLVNLSVTSNAPCALVLVEDARKIMRNKGRTRPSYRHVSSMQTQRMNHANEWTGRGSIHPRSTLVSLVRIKHAVVPDLDPCVIEHLHPGAILTGACRSTYESRNRDLEI